MKKLFFLIITITGFAFASYGQQQGEEGETGGEPCENCTEVLPLVNGNYSTFTGPLSNLIAPCTNPTPIYGPYGAVLSPYFSNSNLLNWYRINGAPGASTLGIGLFTGADNGGGGGDWCRTFGTQGVAANYPFLKNGQYRITVGFDYWSNNCTVPGNVTLSVHAANGLAEPAVPADIVDPAFSLPASATTLGNWNPKEWRTQYNPSPVAFCTPVFTENKNQLYITVTQHLYDDFPSGHTYYGMPAAFSGLMNYAKVELCNECPSVVYNVTGPLSADPVTATLFSAGGLFIDAVINIDGNAFNNNPAENTMLLGKYITTGESNTVGNAFTASANPGKYFLMVPNRACVPPCGPIDGPDEMPCLSVIHFTASPSGGTWSTSSTHLATIDPSGNLTSGSNRSGGTVTVTYTSGNCVLTKVVTVHPCIGKPGSTADQTAPVVSDIASVSSTVEVFPNPARSVITLSFSMPQAQQVDVMVKDVSGRARYVQTINGTGGKTQYHNIDINEFPPGVYFVDITLNGQHVVKKIVKL